MQQQLKHHLYHQKQMKQVKQKVNQLIWIEWDIIYYQQEGENGN